MSLFRSRRHDATIATLYGAIVAQARHPQFYAEAGVPDTVEGRFDMIVLHLALFLRRLRQADGVLPPIGQAVFDRFVTDMDHNLREMGVGEMAVPRRMRGFGEAFYGRTAAYDGALDANDRPALEAALARNLRPTPGGEKILAAYVESMARYLDAMPVDRVTAEDFGFASTERLAVNHV